MAAGFTLKKGHADIEEWTISAGTAYVPGDLFEVDVGSTSCTPSTSGTLCYVRKGVLTHNISATDTLLTVQVVTPDQEWEVQTANSSSSDDNEDAMVLTDENTVNNTGTNSAAKEAVVVQLKPVGAATDKRIRVKFTSTVSGLTHDAA